MIDSSSNAKYLSIAWQIAGPLFGVGFGYLLSNKVWGWQKRWEMKRDAVSDVIKSLGLMNDAARHIADRTICEPDLKHLDHFYLCWENFDRSRCLADLVVSEPLRKALIESRDAIIEFEIYHSTFPKGSANPKVSIEDLKRERDQKINAVYDLARKELNIKSDDSIVAEN